LAQDEVGEVSSVVAADHGDQLRGVGQAQFARDSDKRVRDDALPVDRAGLAAVKPVYWCR
jgi:hypothetical protein